MGKRKTHRDAFSCAQRAANSVDSESVCDDPRGGGRGGKQIYLSVRVARSAVCTLNSMVSGGLSSRL